MTTRYQQGVTRSRRCMTSIPHTYTGVIHVHTDMSDGEGTLEAVLTAARKCGLDFVILTDHGTRGYAQEEMEGWHDDILVLCGEEVTTPEGHFLAFESHADVGDVDTLKEAFARTESLGGLRVSIHHQLPRNNEEDSGNNPQPLEFTDSDLLEIWCFTDEILGQLDKDNHHRLLMSPTRAINGPHRTLLRRWDYQLRKRMLPAIGGLNAHERKEPLFDWKTVFPYTTSFRSIATVVQTPELPNHGPRACQLLWSALRRGRSYIANRDIADEKGFHFEFRPSGEHTRPRMMGEDVPYDKEGRFYIRTPLETEIVLRHNGQPLFWGTGKEITFPIAGAGSYRVELYLDRRLFILSNPIRLTDEDGSIHPTVSDVT